MASRPHPPLKLVQEQYTSPERQVAVRTSRGRLIAQMDESEVLANKGRYTIRRNKRGSITGAFLKERLSLSPLSNNGVHFEQVLPSGHCVFALKGTTGSGRASTLVDEAN